MLCSALFAWRPTAICDWGRRWGLAALLVAVSAAPVRSELLPLPPLESAVPIPPATGSVTPPDYRLGSGDQVVIEVFNAPDYTGNFEVLSDGNLQLPLVGQVRVTNLTLPEATAAITRAYGEYIRQPAVDLALSQTRPIRLAVAGQVARPGAYAFHAEDTIMPLTLSQALQTAGGITQLANIREIQVVRASAPATTVDLWMLLQSGQLTQDVILQDGDTVVVPEVQSLAEAEATRIARANFAPDTIDVYVVGAVASPGRIQLPLNTPVNQAILSAGGFTNRAVEGSVELVRLNGDGSVVKQEIGVDFAQDLSAATNPSLQNNDTIVVRETGLAQAADATSLINSPLSLIFNVLDLIF
ncbi:MAG: polysaccharide biosynthesis/export family protein [Cyanobacteria bacterium P01_A01_bin.105]